MNLKIFNNRLMFHRHLYYGQTDTTCKTNVGRVKIYSTPQNRGVRLSSVHNQQQQRILPHEPMPTTLGQYYKRELKCQFKSLTLVIDGNFDVR